MVNAEMGYGRFLILLVLIERLPPAEKCGKIKNTAGSRHGGRVMEPS